ncbi:hypothetical protein AVEN_218333-1 [Araneus ventricosus]|uniref:Uncharacterized protein n=1 Tax=Araneus ventricosus TaxID=182803 RepID=A0A4Y2N7T8_ARAVE|nr:hypothetical protein AVEN_218333-1 [Araneus ventricosus]
MEFRAHVDKLVGASNWSKWKRQVELLLRHHDVHELISGDRVCLVVAEDATPECQSIWEKLLSVYEQSSGQRLDRLMEQFFRSEKDGDDDVFTRIAKL